MYTKPEVAKLAASLEAIQHPQTKSVQSVLDNYPTNMEIATPNAYAADE